ncbi:dihydrolipoyl dehydrogenase family protein [Aquipuribacter hungaricus]|uniref:Dihydrolipoyl dehydrogenase family protein n=1 Tax=Aquipuribacter hungaricus TaxID=545624 RepID=A0ABV7WI87_9MICO
MSPRARADRPFDLLVVGAGATGLGAARAARPGSRRVGMVETARTGGDCTHYGCVPSKTLLDVAHRVSRARDGRRFGVGEVGPVDFPAVMAHVRSVVAEVEHDESPEQLASEGIDLLHGWARFTGVQADGLLALDVSGTPVTARRVVLAVGAHAALPPVPGLAEADPLTNRTVFGLVEQPRHLLVMGGGPIGVELAQAFRGLGSDVTLVEGAARLLGREEPEASAVVTAVLRRQGVDVRTSTSVTSVATTADGPVLTLSDGTSVTGSHLLVAAGRRPATSGLGLDAVGVETDRAGRVVTDAYLRTTAAGVLAAGDCTSPLQLTHVGDAQGRLAAANAFARSVRLPGVLGGLVPWDDRVVPWVTFTDPEVGRVGLTEAEAHERWGRRARVAVVTMAETDRSRTSSDTDGYVKLVVAPGRLGGPAVLDRVVGLTAVCPHGGELAGTGALAVRTGMLAARLAQTVAPYPTYSLALRVAAARLFGSYGGQTWRPARPDEDADGD